MQNLLKIAFALLFLTIIQQADGQAYQQNIRGTIIDADSKMPLIGANIAITNIDPVKGSSTDVDGYFKIENVDIGRIDIMVTYLGYETTASKNILLTSGKELVLNIELTESATLLEEVVVKASNQKAEVLNEMATVSARSFSVEETSRYASSLSDPARMAQNYAGVSIGGGGTDDLFNEIVVRGNSPRGVMWRLEGIEIPNPNHFGALGNSGGAISMLSSSTLSNSDFYTGAFPSEFGNATSGVFDLNMRNGNNEKREYAIMFGALGLEVAAEGPFSKNSKASYLINYRYSTLALLEAAGLNPAGDVLPKYQDLSFKINVPTKKAGVFSLFGLGGANVASFVPKQDSSLWVNYDDDKWGFSENQIVGTIGLSHRYLLTDKSYIRTVAVASSDNYDDEEYYLVPENNYDRMLDNFSNFKNNTFRISTTYTNKIDAKNTFRAGGIASHITYNFKTEYLVDEENRFATLFDNKGSTQMYQAFAHWKHRFNEKLTLNGGLHYTLFALNNTSSLEPRLGLKWKLSDKRSLSFALGIHSKPEHISFYLAEQSYAGGIRTSPNKDLDMLKSGQAVIGYDQALGKDLRLSVEAYYQHLYDVPVLKDTLSRGSIINTNDIWDIIGGNEAVNEGTGRNYGIDLTLEKLFSNQYYFLLTGSLFESKFTPIDGVEYNTRFNSNYQLNILGGKEFKVGKTKKNIIGVNVKAVYGGGNRYSPVDIAASMEEGYTVRDRSKIYSISVPDYYRFDLGLSYKINKKNTTHSIMIDIQNVTGRQNVFSEYFNQNTQKSEFYYQTGFLPTFNYRVEF